MTLAQREVGASRRKAGTIDAVLTAYMQSDTFTKGLADATRQSRRSILENFADTQAPSGQRYGEKGILTLQRRHVQAIFEGMSHDKKRNWIKALRGLMVYAIAKEIRTDDPTRGVTVERAAKSSGYMTWMPEQVEQYRARHPLGTTARLALELLLNIAARRYDAHEIGPQHLIISNRDGVKKLCWRPHKTLRTSGKLLKIKVLPTLQAALDAMPKPERGTAVALAFLTNENGKAFASADSFGLRFAKWCDEAGLQPVMCDDGKVRNYRAHGLRKAALTAAAHAGCTLHELMALSGHASPTELQKYLEEVEQERMADRAMDKLEAAEG